MQILNKSRFIAVNLMLATMLLLNQAMAEVITEHVAWDKAPVHIYLPLNKEKIIEFPQPVLIDSKVNKLAKAILANGRLYIKATREFNNQRVLVKSKTGGEVYILDFSVSNKANTNTLSIVHADDAKANHQASSQPSNKDRASTHSGPTATTISKVELMRFVVNKFYGLERLVEHNPNIYRVPMRTSKIVPIYPGKNIKAMPVAQFRGGDNYVTAIYLKNLSQDKASIDPRAIRGNWLSAAIFPVSELNPAKLPQDDTMLFLMSKRPFAETLREVVGE